MMDVSGFVKYCEDHYGDGLYRKIRVIPADKTPDGKKRPMGEKSNMPREEVRTNRCSVDNPNNYSLYIKYMPLVYCVDFDTKGLGDNELYTCLLASETFYTETAKGYHFYVKINDAPDYKNEVDLAHPDYFANPADVDLINCKRNIWEVASRKVYGKQIAEMDWDDLEKYFDTTRMNICGPELVLAEPPAKDVPADNNQVALIGDIPRCDISEMERLLARLNETRCDSYDDWYAVSQAIHNNFDGDPDGYALYKEWSSQSAKYNEAKAKQFWKTMTTRAKTNPPDRKSSYLAIKRMANEDTPENEYHEAFQKGGEKSMVAMMNKTIHFKQDTSEFIHREEDDPKLFTIKKAADLRLNFANRSWKQQIGTKWKEYKPFDMWCQSIYRKEVRRIDFDPSCRERNIYNLWQGYDITAQMCKDAPAKDCQHLLDHLFNMWCCGEQLLYDYVLNWFAWVIQKPERKIGVMMAINSVQGCGKGIVLGILQRIMDGDKPRGYYDSLSSVESVIGTYSSAIEGKCLVNFDEAYWGGDKRKEGEIKNLITETTQEIRQKYVKPYNIKNTTAFIITTNNSLFAGMTEDDRRHMCLKANDTMFEGMDRHQKTDYFNKVSGQTPDDCYDPKVVYAFANILYTRDLSEFIPSNFPKTSLAQDQIRRGWSTTTRFWFDVLNKCEFDEYAAGYGEYVDKYKIPFPTGTGDSCGARSKKDGTVFYHKDWLFKRYQEKLFGAFGRKENQQNFWSQTDKIFSKTMRTKKIKAHTGHTHSVGFQPMDKLREQFRKYQKYDGTDLWDDENMDDADSDEEFEYVGAGVLGGYGMD